MKVWRLNRKRDKRKQWWLQSTKSFQKSLYLKTFLTLSHNLTLSEFESRFLNSMQLLNSCKHYMRLISLSSVHLKRACEVAIFIFLKINKEFAHVVSSFHPGLENMSIIWKIWNSDPRLKFHHDLAKPSWNFNSVYRVEILACNFDVIFKSSLLFSRDEISAWLNELKFQNGSKISL